MIVVSDTTPLRYLSVLGHLELLPRLFGRAHRRKFQLNRSSSACC